MPSLLTPLTALKGIGPNTGKKFLELGLLTLEDLLFYFPIRHQDWRTRVSLADAQAGDMVTVVGQIDKIRSRQAWRRRGLSITEATLTDDSASMPVIWFNQPYLQKTLVVGKQYFFSGRIEPRTGKQRKRDTAFQMVNPAFEPITANPSHQRLVPVYATVDGLSQRQIRLAMKQAVALANLVPDHVPPDIQQRYGLISRVVALRNVHFPAGPAEAAAAVRRLQFDELVIWQLRWLAEAEQYGGLTAPTFPFLAEAIRAFVQRLPFELTTDQRQAAWEMLQEIGRPRPMSRLLQADVGAGKTVVAALLAYNIAHQGGQVAFLVPTVVLAQQHFRTLQKLFAGTDTSLAMMVGEVIVTPDGQTLSRGDFGQRLRQGKIQVVIGTHALLEASVPWSNLGLVIVDEQQRFGVAQRASLIEYGRRSGQGVPHFLSLTATPIPRTLALVLGGELVIHRLLAKPPGRTPITSQVITGADRSAVTQAMSATIARGEQVFLVTPLIEESDVLGVRAAITEYEYWRKARPDWRVALVHGSQPTAERQAVMTDFAAGRFDVLVSTTVIEVGIDVPNATLMVIEGAERFGLAQLHQLRGRVGRGAKPSTCLFVTDQNGPAVAARLDFVAKTDDGLALAEADLQRRGPGELYGLRQSGLPDWKIATLNDPKLLEEARAAAQEIHRQGFDRSVLMDEDWKKPTGAQHRE